jgi:hypothetical protein
MINFLEEQRRENYAVTSYGFVTCELGDLVNYINPGQRPRMSLGSASGFNEATVRIYGMQRNYL